MRLRRDVDLLVEIGETRHRCKQAIHAIARERGWSVLDILLTEQQLPSVYKPRLAIIADDADSALIEQLRNLGTHVVRIGAGTCCRDSILPAALYDRKAEGVLAAEHFAERGFRDVGVVHYYGPNIYDAAFRDRAIELGCRFHEIDLSAFYEPADMSPAEVHQAMATHFLGQAAHMPRPLGLLLRSDELAARVCHFCVLGNLRIPDEIALLGRSNNVTICDFAPVRLSSLELDSEGRIGAAIALMDDMIAGRKTPGHAILIPPKGVVTRDSTDVRASQNTDVAKALRYMWDHYADMELNVDKVANTLGFSRRKLERLFQGEIGQTVNDALLARRLERCCEMLITTDAPVSDICYRVGLRSREHLHRAFRRAYGMTLKEFRQNQTAAKTRMTSHANCI